MTLLWITPNFDMEKIFEILRLLLPFALGLGFYKVMDSIKTYRILRDKVQEMEKSLIEIKAILLSCSSESSIVSFPIPHPLESKSVTEPIKEIEASIPQKGGNRKPRTEEQKALMSAKKKAYWEKQKRDKQN